MDFKLGKDHWVIPDGYIPSQSNGPEPAMASHEATCILNTSNEKARIRIYIYFSDREPAGPYKFIIPPRRTKHLRFNELDEPEPVPRDTNYASVVRSSVPVVVQHTRLDSRQAENALLSTIAYGE